MYWYTMLENMQKNIHTYIYISRYNNKILEEICNINSSYLRWQVCVNRLFTSRLKFHIFLDIIMLTLNMMSEYLRPYQIVVDLLVLYVIWFYPHKYIIDVCIGKNVYKKNCTSSYAVHEYLLGNITWHSILGIHNSRLIQHFKSIACCRTKG